MAATRNADVTAGTRARVASSQYARYSHGPQAKAYSQVPCCDAGVPLHALIGEKNCSFKPDELWQLFFVVWQLLVVVWQLLAVGGAGPANRLRRRAASQTAHELHFTCVVALRYVLSGD